MAGLASGIAFIIVMMFWADSIILPLRSPNDFIKVANELDEVKEFLSKYPTTNSTVYWRCLPRHCPSQIPPPIVEYSYKEKHTDKYTDIRIQIEPNDGKPIFFQIRCLTIVDGEGSDSVEIHGSRIEQEKIAEFFQDARCPK